jgi:hypothetical protein
MTPSNKLKIARSNFKRAMTRWKNEQCKGAHDMSAKQTRRMCLATYARERAAFKLREAMRSVCDCGQHGYQYGGCPIHGWWRHNNRLDKRLATN